jgi:cytidyltransferase-like protein
MDSFFRRRLLRILFSSVLLLVWYSPALAAHSVCLDAFRESKRYGLVQLSRPLPLKENLKIGFYFGTFDPLHEGHVAVMQEGLKAGLDAVVAIPNFLTAHKPNATSLAHRSAMSIARTEPLEGITIMLDDGGLSAKVSKDAPVLALIGVTKPKETTLLIGDDSFVGMLERIDLAKVPFDHVRIFTRGETVLKIPKVSRPIVEIVDLGSQFKGLSSTQIRSAQKKRRRDTARYSASARSAVHRT